MTAFLIIIFLTSTVFSFAQWGAAIYVGSEIGHAKGRSGVLWAVFFSWLGVLAVYMLPSNES